MSYASPRRVCSFGIAVVLAGALSAGPMPSTGAEPQRVGAGVGVESTPNGPVRQLVRPSAPARVTLITGDTVIVSEDRDGRVAVAMEPSSLARSMYETVRTPDDDVYVIPEVARSALDRGLIDRELFNVTDLIAQGYGDQGYGDQGTDAVPVIVRYADDPGPRTLAAQADRLPASELTLGLPRLDYAAVEVDKARAERFWRGAMSARGPRGEYGSIDHIWLDRTIEASLDESIPLIGADDAWAAGWDGSGVTVAVLDTGVDPTHPDLVDRLGATESFVPDEPVTDGSGHGTHVASTIAGTGAASEGRFTGVAPGSDLIVGKVLANSGNGQMSWAIAGMEWAVQQGADVVNMSLGASATDGTDPASVALNELSASSDTLFVVAAGNSGRFGNDFTVGTPAAADAALAVANFDKSDRRSDSSSRGPRVGDYALKPEIAAPGSSIGAARAAGTSRGTPIDEFYTRLSGTSMASPHVAGVAAMLAQRYPDWDGEQIKDALMSTAVHLPDYTVYLQGSGRVDAARATSQAVFGTGKADFRRLDATSPEQSRTITYSNTGEQDVTLDLGTDITLRGSAAAPGMFTLSHDTVTVPAGGTADVELTLDPSIGDTGRYTGQVTATGADGVALTTAVGFEKEAPSANLTIRVFDRNGDRPYATTVFIQDAHDATRYFERVGAGHTHEVTVRVPLGDHSLQGSMASRDPGGTGLYYASDMFALPNVSVTGDTTVTIDARQAQDLEMDVIGDSRPLDRVRVIQGVYRLSEYGGSGYAVGSNLSRTNTRYGAIPSDTADIGELHYSPYLTQREPLMRARTIEPYGSSIDFESPETNPRFDGRRRLDLVDVGAGQPADYDGTDVTGKVALVQSSSSSSSLIQNAVDHGAVAVVFAKQEPGVFITSAPQGVAIPVMSVSYDEGRRLTGMAANGPVRIILTGERESEYGYPLRLTQRGGIPDDLSMRVSRRDLVRVDNSFHSDVPDRLGQEIQQSMAPWDTITGGEVIPLLQPARRVDYIVPGADLKYQHVVRSNSGSSRVSVINALTARYVAGRDVEVSWHKQPYHATEEAHRACNFCRTDAQLRFRQQPNGDAELGHWGSGAASIGRQLYRDGTAVADPNQLLVAEPATYRIVDRMQRTGAPDVTYARQARTEWTFQSEAPTGLEVPGCESVLPGATECGALPVLLPRYDLPLDLRNRARAGESMVFTAYADRAVGYNGPAASRMTVAASFDGGATWRSADRLPARTHGDGFRFRIRHPELANTNGYVWLRLEAGDGDGNRVAQTIERAYGLRAG